MEIGFLRTHLTHGTAVVNVNCRKAGRVNRVGNAKRIEVMLVFAVSGLTVNVTLILSLADLKLMLVDRMDKT